MAETVAPSIVPSPDPSALTTASLNQAKAELKDDYRDRLASLHLILATRLDAMDKAAILLAESVNRVPTLLDREIGRLQSLAEEKVLGIEKQFRERDIRAAAAETAQKESASAASIAAQTAVNAALQAQKEAAAAQNESNAAAITKSEASAIKQMDGILALLASNNNALNDKITVINGRLDRGEGGHSAFSANLSTGISIIAVLITLMIGVTAFFSHSHSPDVTLQR